MKTLPNMYDILFVVFFEECPGYSVQYDKSAQGLHFWAVQSKNKKIEKCHKSIINAIFLVLMNACNNFVWETHQKQN